MKYQHQEGRSLEQVYLNIVLNHVGLATFLWDVANSADLEQMPQNAASDQGLCLLLTKFSVKI